MKDLLTKAELSREFHISERTIQDKIKGIESQITKGRYKPHAVIRNGKVLMCNIVVFADYLVYEKQLQDESLSKLVPQFNFSVANQYVNYGKEKR